MNEDLFHWPGRYRLWRCSGRLRIAVTVRCSEGDVTHVQELAPREGYAFLMARRRTELLYAICQAASVPAVRQRMTFAELVRICALGDERELCALADRWNGSGRVARALGELLPWPNGSGAAAWMRPVRRAKREEMAC